MFAMSAQRTKRIVEMVSRPSTFKITHTQSTQEPLVYKQSHINFQMVFTDTKTVKECTYQFSPDEKDGIKMFMDENKMPDNPHTKEKIENVFKNIFDEWHFLSVTTKAIIDISGDFHYAFSSIKIGTSYGLTFNMPANDFTVERILAAPDKPLDADTDEIINYCYDISYKKYFGSPPETGIVWDFSMKKYFSQVLDKKRSEIAKKLNEEDFLDAYTVFFSATRRVLIQSVLKGFIKNTSRDFIDKIMNDTIIEEVIST